MRFNRVHAGGADSPMDEIRLLRVVGYQYVHKQTLSIQFLGTQYTTPQAPFCLQANTGTLQEHPLACRLNSNNPRRVYKFPASTIPITHLLMPYRLTSKIGIGYGSFFLVPCH